MLAVALFLVLAFFFLEILSYLKGSNVLVSNSIRSMPHLSHRTHKEKSLFSKVGSFHTISLVAQDSTLSGWFTFVNTSFEPLERLNEDSSDRNFSRW